MYCKNCGNYIEKGQARCSNCGNKQITTQKIIKRVLLILAIVVVYIVAFFMYIDNKYMNDSNSIKKILVGSAGNVLDENDHLNDIHIESEQQIENTFIYLGTWNEFSALADIDIGVVYLRNVQVVFRVPMFFFNMLKWIIVLANRNIERIQGMIMLKRITIRNLSIKWNRDLQVGI